jgi:pyruvate dehydrogenase E1 component alpha subunit
VKLVFSRSNILKDIYKKALRIRVVEETIAKRYKEQKMRCPVHLSIGQELNAALLGMCLKKDDQLVSTHRGHAHYLAKGGSLIGLIGELHGKASGCARGFGGSMHLCDRDVGFMGSTSIVGGTIPIGVGSAFSDMLGTGSRIPVTTICLGDAATEQGVFFEAWNFAKVHRLPCVFFIEDNLYSCFTHIKERRYDGMILPPEYTVLSMYDWLDNKIALDDIIAKTRGGAGPHIVVIKTYRYVEHCGPNNDDHLGYRHHKEIKMHPDPVNKLGLELLTSNIVNTQWMNKRLGEYQEEVDGVFALVESDPFPPEYELGMHTYANE